MNKFTRIIAEAVVVAGIIYASPAQAMPAGPDFTIETAVAGAHFTSPFYGSLGECRIAASTIDQRWGSGSKSICAPTHN